MRSRGGTLQPRKTLTPRTPHTWAWTTCEGGPCGKGSVGGQGSRGKQGEEGVLVTGSVVPAKSHAGGMTASKEGGVRVGSVVRGGGGRSQRADCKDGRGWGRRGEVGGGQGLSEGSRGDRRLKCRRQVDCSKRSTAWTRQAAYDDDDLYWYTIL